MTGSRRALITGAAGQDGILLARLLIDQGYSVAGVVRPGSHRVALLSRHVPEVDIIEGDIRDAAAVRAIFDATRPHEIYNLAGFSSVARSWDQAGEAMAVNAQAVVGILDAVRDLEAGAGSKTRYYQASSSEMFGRPDRSPQDEDTPVRPVSPYGVSKAAAHLLTSSYRASYELFACCGILYNHESPFREPHFVTRKISMGVAAIATGQSKVLELGTLDVERDWGYAPDYVRAMWLMLQADDPADYVVATGRSHSLREFLDVAFMYIGIHDWSECVRSDQRLLRPLEVSNLVGDSSKARRHLSWLPSVGFEDLVERMVEYDLGLMRGETSRPLSAT